MTDSRWLNVHLPDPPGVKFLVLTDPRIGKMDAFLGKLHEFYADFALKNPFYSLEMPIRCQLFDTNLTKLVEQMDRTLAAQYNIQ